MKRHNRPFPRISPGPKRALRLHRIALGLTQFQLADRLGVRQTLISEIEIGRVIPDASLKDRIAEVFGCSPAEIFPELAHETPAVPPAKEEDGGSL